MNSKLKSLMFGGALAAAASISAPALAANGKLVQLTVQTEDHMAGVPSIPTQTVVRKICSGAGHFDPEQLLKAEAKTDCKITHYKMHGKDVSFDQVCTKPVAVLSHGEFHLTDAADFTGKLHTEINMAGHAMSIDTSYTGKQIGTCNYVPGKD